jgi:hypothetical protein
MVALDVPWWEVVKAVCSPSSLLEIAGETYLVVGFLVAGFIALRGMKLRRPPTNGVLWDKRDNVRNGLFLFQSIVLLWPIAFIIEVALWPLVLLFLWADQADDDETI